MIISSTADNLLSFNDKMSRRMTKPTKLQQRLRSTWAYAQSDQSHLIAKDPRFLHVDSEDSD